MYSTTCKIIYNGEIKHETDTENCQNEVFLGEILYCFSWKNEVFWRSLKTRRNNVSSWRGLPRNNNYMGRIGVLTDVVFSHYKIRCSKDRKVIFF